MSPQDDDSPRSSRPRASTSSFPQLPWRRPRSGSVTAPTQPAPPTPALTLEALIEALTPPAVPSLSHARNLCNVLTTQTPSPRYAVLSPIVASLSSSDSPPSLQAAGYEILGTYWKHSGSSILTTADRLSCLSLFFNSAVPWSTELWEPRFNALVAIIQSGAETVEMESDLLKVLRSWIEGAFEGLTRREPPSADEWEERERSVKLLTDFLTTLVGKAEFVSRLSEEDTSEVLNLWGRLIDRALSVSSESFPLPSMPASPVNDVHASKTTSPSRLHLAHRRHQSSISISQMRERRHPADMIVEAYVTYLATRLTALAPHYLKSILPLLFRCLAYYSTPLPRIALSSNPLHHHPLEKLVTQTLKDLVSGPYSSSCTILVKRYLFPPLQACVSGDAQRSVGALRTLRLSIRDTLSGRLVRAFITRANATEYTPAGVLTRIDLEQDSLARAYAQDELASWDLLKFRGVLCRAIKAWVEAPEEGEGEQGAPTAAREQVLTEAANIVKDVVQALDARDEDDEVDDDEVDAVGDILRALVVYVQHLTDHDGMPVVLSLSRVDDTTPLLAAISTLLGQDLNTTAIYPVLPGILLSVAGHIPDADTAILLKTMSERQSLSPMSPGWLAHWSSVLAIPGLFRSSRVSTREHAMSILDAVWEFVKDIPDYRRPLAKLVFEFWQQQTEGRTEDVAMSVVFRVLGDEVICRSAESNADTSGESEDSQVADQILYFLTRLAGEREDEEDDAASIRTTDAPMSMSPQASHMASTASSPTLVRSQTELPVRERDGGLPSLSAMSSFLTNTFNTGHSSRSQSQPRPSLDSAPSTESPPALPAEAPSMLKSVGAVAALASVFSQLAFTPLVHIEENMLLARRVFETLIELLGTAECIRARLTILQFIMRFRVDRDHKLYYASRESYDKDGNIASLAALINRNPNHPATAEQVTPTQEVRTARPRVPQERDGRRPSRGRGGQPAKMESRSRSRTNPRLVSAPASLRQFKARDPLWLLPETPPFTIDLVDTPSEVIMSYDPSGPKDGVVLPWSKYLRRLVEMVEGEKEWEVLSYVLCHLPTQLANKHLFCGPKSKIVLGEMVHAICTGILNNNLAGHIERWPDNLIPRDAHGLAYHTLTVLISYKRCFPDLHVRHLVVEAFLQGLSGQSSTIKCCLHALSLSAFELQPSMTRYLSTILKKLSDIMSNPAMAVHIIDFLAIVGSVPTLHSNFTEDDYKMVFGVALQYLQHYNHSNDMPISGALAQHVRIMSYYIVYLWFLAVDLHDRPRHIKYISRQLLLANEGREEIDEPTEVCFDWLARYTYASADPRPAESMLNDIVMNPSVQQQHHEPAVSEKSWIGGTAVITVRTLARRGWMEVITRRSSGLTKFLCRAENVPMVPVGDVDPDMASVAATLTLDRGFHSRGVEEWHENRHRRVKSLSCELRFSVLRTSLIWAQHELQSNMGGPTEDEALKPDPITGYIWSGSAPSQRRKNVAIDPAYFALQLSSYPDNVSSAKLRPVTDSNRLQSFFRSLDRMPVIDTHKVGIMYVAPGQREESEILRNSHGSPAYSRFLEGLARLINLRGQKDVYAGGLDPDDDGEYAYAWWDDTGQILFHTATLMPASDANCLNKKAHIGNDFVRIVWNDSGMPYRFDTLATQFQFVNIVIEPHSRGAIAAFSNNLHENEYFKVIVQRAEGMTEFTPIGDFKLISAEKLPLLVRQLSLLTDWFVSVYQHTKNDTERTEMVTNWRSRLQAIKRFRAQMLSQQPFTDDVAKEQGPKAQLYRDFTTIY
ncbi:uncharacterized protein B0H18DRAFT_884997 [Fomitopsis serialis]|uniref:uncharacterized protein n=1 Tax=Fomitopsis serialis TaxID=139415 RepID=UPI0020089BAA|nr:uncharacterized protein B0H18DRAFT_884997 [Neoantrodia serialis]KAH9916196.1 hypothetical protein B0H18DRAFT_884997 [Neoantrodia serialis]